MCLPVELIPEQLADDTDYFSLYANTGRQNVGRISSGSNANKNSRFGSD
jgi:hypothetical protein